MGFRKSIKKLLPRTLFGRSLVILVVPVLLIQLITSYVFFDRHWSKVTTRLAYAVAGEIAGVSELVEVGTSLSLEEIAELAQKTLDLHVNFSALHDLVDVPVISQANLGWESMVANTLATELGKALGIRKFSLEMDFANKWVSVYVQVKQGVLKFGFPQRRLFSSSGYIFLLWVLASSILLLAVAIIFMRNQIRPIRKLAAAAKRFGKGRDVAYFKPGGAIEVRQAAEAFINMNTRVRRAMEQRTTMLAGVSHDLKTPLTRLKLELSMLENSVDVSAMQGDIAEMETMIAGYLEFVRGEGDEEASAMDLSGLLDKVCDSAQRQGFEITRDYEDHLSFTLRPLAFERCLNNLVSNAGQYGGKIWLRAGYEEECLKICVEDDGDGVDENQYEDLFRPFYRGDEARSADSASGSGHVGLGLPIAQDIVHAHGGKISLGRSAHGGLSVHISLPI